MKELGVLSNPGHNSLPSCASTSLLILQKPLLGDGFPGVSVQHLLLQDSHQAEYAGREYTRS